MMKKAQFGLTTLIIFIAMIVTAAVAAGVIIYTTQQLQQTALQTGAQAQQRVSTGIEVNRVFGVQYEISTGKLNRDLQAVSVISPVMRLMAGSGPINLQQIQFLYTDENGNVKVFSTSSSLPAAVYALLQGGDYLVTGFMYNNSIDVSGVVLTGSICNNLTSYNGKYITVVVSNGTCSISLNTANLTNPIPLENLLTVLKEMNNAGIQNPYAVVGLAVSRPSVYLQSGDIYEVMLYLAGYIYPQNTYTLQIIPYHGYITTVQGRLPTVLVTPVVDIWAAS